MQTPASFRTITGTLGLLTALLCIGCGQKVDVPDDGRPWTAFMEDLVTYEQLPILGDSHIRMVSSADPTGGNNDFNNFQSRSKEPGWVVLLDEQGPGCIRRLWMTGTDMGHPVRIYIDGEKTPRLEAGMEDLFGNTEPWLPPLAQYHNMCFYSYVPIPFNRSIRIETKEPNVHPVWGPRRIYYHISVETYSDGRSVESYPAQFTDQQLAMAAQVRDRWDEVLESRDVPITDASINIVVGSRERATVWEQEGPGNLAAWLIAVTPDDPNAWTVMDTEYLLQDAVLRVYYDGRDEASIATPLGDFFSNAWRKRELGNLWMTSGPDGYNFRVPMPFRESIRFEIENGADRPIRVAFKPETTEGPGQDAGYLHAEWRRSGPQTDENHLITAVQGRGKFLGCFLGVTGLDNSWWILEGDERMWVDDSKEPVWDGTGLEDYFNGGWYYRGAVFSALSASLDRSPFRVAQYRHQHPDPVSFERNFRMDFERMRNPQTGAPVQGWFHSVAYFYLAEPTAVVDAPADRTARRAVDDPYYPQTLLLQILELERMNDFRSALRAVEEYLERFPDADDTGVYRLRHLEYRRHLGEPITAESYEPFLQGEHGEAAQEQARLLTWYYENDRRAIIGMSVNGLGRLYLDGQTVLTGDHPYNLFVAGIELDDGPHALAGQVEARRSDPWFQVGIRTHTGVTGTGMGTLAGLELHSGWRTTDVHSPPWHSVGIRDIPRGAPDAPYIGGIGNAFILVQSKSYPVSMPGWGTQGNPAYFRENFTVPIKGWPSFARDMTGLSR